MIQEVFVSHYENGYNSVMKTAGIKTAVRREVVEILKKLKDDPSGGKATKLIQDMADRGYEPRRFLKELGAGEEGVADLVAHVDRANPSRTGLAVDKKHLDNAFYTTDDALQRKEEYLRQMTEEAPDSIANFYGSRTIPAAGGEGGSGANRVFTSEYVPNTRHATKSDANRVTRQMRNAEQRADTDYVGTDFHPGNINVGPDGNPKAVDTIAEPRGNTNRWDLYNKDPETWRQPYGNPYGKGMLRRRDVSHIPQNLEGQRGSAYKAYMHRGANIDDVMGTPRELRNAPEPDTGAFDRLMGNSSSGQPTNAPGATSQPTAATNAPGATSQPTAATQPTAANPFDTTQTQPTAARTAPQRPPQQDFVG